MVSGGCGCGAWGLQNGMWAEGRLWMTLPAWICQTWPSASPGGVYVCVGVCKGVCGHECVHGGVCVSVHGCVHGGVCMCMYVRVCACLCMGVCGYMCCLRHKLFICSTLSLLSLYPVGCIWENPVPWVLPPGHAHLQRCHPAQGLGTCSLALGRTQKWWPCPRGQPKGQEAALCPQRGAGCFGCRGAVHPPLPFPLTC